MAGRRRSALIISWHLPAGNVAIYYRTVCFQPVGCLHAVICDYQETWLYPAFLWLIGGQWWGITGLLMGTFAWVGYAMAFYYLRKIRSIAQYFIKSAEPVVLRSCILIAVLLSKYLWRWVLASLLPAWMLPVSIRENIDRNSCFASDKLFLPYYWETPRSNEPTNGTLL